MSECVKSSGAVFDRIVFKLPVQKDRQFTLTDKAVGVAAALLGGGLYYALSLNKTVQLYRGPIAAATVATIQIGMCFAPGGIGEFEQKSFSKVSQYRLAKPLSSQQRAHVHARAFFTGVCFTALYFAAEHYSKLIQAGKVLTPGGVATCLAVFGTGTWWTIQWAMDDGRRQTA